ncbi:hypothetical protein N646_2074 [Vibrio alginolyticus NBRC 15630 = ATCC 17749]|uniref:Uncharacterized protein n=1 Tax=Vibrio alginolyticus (strain ATCC 17749 / DSM 2171 / NBRC 15630 / NCIMB 1903 / NCTC 12160 / XII-53) TaxID=1219076 RepID=A0A2I3CCK1_VIBAX|nr:hypothetical protein N646_2074 [Vibrio alginolyticus NBRC 15630 = ATCC 17749]
MASRLDCFNDVSRETSCRKKRSVGCVFCLVLLLSLMFNA